MTEARNEYQVKTKLTVSAVSSDGNISVKMFLEVTTYVFTYCTFVSNVDV